MLAPGEFHDGHGLWCVEATPKVGPVQEDILTVFRHSESGATKPSAVVEVNNGADPTLFRRSAHLRRSPSIIRCLVERHRATFCERLRHDGIDAPDVDRVGAQPVVARVGMVAVQRNHCGHLAFAFDVAQSEVADAGLRTADDLAGEHLLKIQENSPFAQPVPTDGDAHFEVDKPTDGVHKQDAAVVLVSLPRLRIALGPVDGDVQCRQVFLASIDPTQPGSALNAVDHEVLFGRIAFDPDVQHLGLPFAFDEHQLGGGVRPGVRGVFAVSLIYRDCDFTESVLPADTDALFHHRLLVIFVTVVIVVVAPVAADAGRLILVATPDNPTLAPGLGRGDGDVVGRFACIGQSGQDCVADGGVFLRFVIGKYCLCHFDLVLF